MSLIDELSVKEETIEVARSKSGVILNFSTEEGDDCFGYRLLFENFQMVHLSIYDTEDGISILSLSGNKLDTLLDSSWKEHDDLILKRVSYYVLGKIAFLTKIAYKAYFYSNNTQDYSIYHRTSSRLT